MTAQQDIAALERMAYRGGAAGAIAKHALEQLAHNKIGNTMRVTDTTTITLDGMSCEATELTSILSRHGSATVHFSVDPADRPGSGENLVIKVIKDRTEVTRRTINAELRDARTVNVSEDRALQDRDIEPGCR